jgi:quercetin dioxygenase-like cupin family protein
MDLYNWNSIVEEQLNPRLSRKVIHTPNMTIARLHVQKYAVVPEHSHANEQVTTVERGALKFVMDGQEQIVRAGEALVIPPHASHLVEALEDTVVVDVFVPARHDWLQGDDSYLRK